MNDTTGIPGPTIYYPDWTYNPNPYPSEFNWSVIHVDRSLEIAVKIDDILERLHKLESALEGMKSKKTSASSKKRKAKASSETI